MISSSLSLPKMAVMRDIGPKSMSDREFQVLHHSTHMGVLHPHGVH